MAGYCWTITNDFIADSHARSGTNGNAIGLVGPRSATMTEEEICRHPDRKRFRMLDDDGEVYYTGYLVGGDGFEPLDDFGMPNAGATTIEYWEGDEWRPL